jgi:hypothetical protein
MSIVTANVTTVTGNVYVSSGNTAITFLSMCNYSGNTVTANLYVVPNGDTVGNNNIVLASIELTGNVNNAGDTYQLYQAAEKLLLGPGDSIWADANANSAVTVVTSYTTI